MRRSSSKLPHQPREPLRPTRAHPTLPAPQPCPPCSAHLELLLKQGVLCPVEGEGAQVARLGAADLDVDGAVGVPPRGAAGVCGAGALQMKGKSELGGAVQSCRCSRERQTAQISFLEGRVIGRPSVPSPRPPPAAPSHHPPLSALTSSSLTRSRKLDRTRHSEVASESWKKLMR